MATVKLKPTSPGKRGAIRVTRDYLFKGDPIKALIEKKRKINGRNNAGRITVRHRGGAHKRHYRIIDFKRQKDGLEGKVERDNEALRAGIKREMRELEETLMNKLQRALDNPLAN